MRSLATSSRLWILTLITSIVVAAVLFFKVPHNRNTLPYWLALPTSVATEVGTDPQSIIRFCGDSLSRETYNDVVRGPFGTLWSRGGNAWDRSLLAVAAMEASGYHARLVADAAQPRVAYKDQDQWIVIALGQADKPERRANAGTNWVALSAIDRSQAVPLRPMQISFDLVRNGFGSKTTRWSRQTFVAEWICTPAWIATVPINNGVQYALHLGRETLTTSSDLRPFDWATLSIQFSPPATGQSVDRELFRRRDPADNVAGHGLTSTGDIYCVTTATGPYTAQTAESRRRLLGALQREGVCDSLVVALTMLGMSYFTASDEATHGFASSTQSRVSWLDPRLAIIALEMPDSAGQPKRDVASGGILSFDVLANDVTIVGSNAIACQFARGLRNDLIESECVYRATGQDVVSASTIFSNFLNRSAQAPEMRMRTLERELDRLLYEELNGSSSRVLMGPSTPSPISIVRSAQGLVAHGVREVAEVPTDRVLNRFQVGSDMDSVEFGTDSEACATIVDAVLANSLTSKSYDPRFEVRSLWAQDGFMLRPGSVAIYDVVEGADKYRIGVRVEVRDGLVVGRATNISTGVSWNIDNQDGPALARGIDGHWQLLRLTHMAVPAENLPVTVPMLVDIGGHNVTIRAFSKRVKTLLPTGNYTEAEVSILGGSLGLIGKWNQQDLRVTLASVSAVRAGVVVDDKAGIPHAVVRSLADSRSRRTDGSGHFYTSESVALKPRVVIAIDRSGSMAFGMSVTDSVPAEHGVRRIDQVVKAIDTISKDFSIDAEVALWSFTTTGAGRDEELLIRTEQNFTTTLHSMSQAVAGLVPDGATPIASVVERLVELRKQDPLDRPTIGILLTDGENTDEADPVAVYDQEGGGIVIHTVGFAVPDSGNARRTLELLAAKSGGIFVSTTSAEALQDVLRGLMGTATGRLLEVSAVGYERMICDAPTEHASVPLKITLKAACDCDHEVDRGLITVTHQNAALLDSCNGLTSEARNLIEKRLADGRWSVRIPTERTFIGGVSAYAWFEIETATGRCIGRTEDGLHGCVASPGHFPGAVQKAGRQPYFVVWYQGIVAYTAGSVLGAMSWYRQPGAIGGSGEDLARFVQATGLQVAADFADEAVDGEAAGAFWSGVCLNFTLQARALGLPRTQLIECYASWWKSYCVSVIDNNVRGRVIPSDETEGPGFNAAIDEAYERLAPAEYKQLLETIKGYGCGAPPVKQSAG